MSQPVKAALLATKDLRGTDRLVVLAIAAHADRSGDAWPSVATIADYVGVSERTVQRSLARLVQAGRLVVRQVAGIVTRVYRLVVDGVSSAIKGVTSGAAGATDQAPGGDSQGASPEVEDPQKLKGRAAARNWRRFVPKNKAGADPVRRGAAPPPPPGADQCPRHRGSLAHNCGPCRSERYEAATSPYAPAPAGGAR
ncbi:helix-turn-helix domain-containing protein [Micromonospora sp. NPDC047730]|uniref:helix-turn-helix domain-containing protein n=1 Tax=Micromonospora sp. NPDC047730 TaxID=3364253 RepID=UPI0037197E92